MELRRFIISKVEKMADTPNIFTNSYQRCNNEGMISPTYLLIVTVFANEIFNELMLGSKPCVLGIYKPLIKLWMEHLKRGGFSLSKAFIHTGPPFLGCFKIPYEGMCTKRFRSKYL
ncbi:unnamed protein product [Moneuplotes crassus]|uniref:Uncharacterized protein n=1 Tax=Euplotes crassus TaxID=5936 RepID=A0AAD1U7I7_EUPCR|nr:unnamed protein product [Moneuplotes crassus]